MQSTTDMAMKATVPDMSMPPLNCLQFAICVVNCFNTTTIPAGQNPFQVCGSQCAPMSTSTSINKWQAALVCGQNYCLGTNDASVAKCVDSNGQLVDQPGQTGVCTACLNNATGALLGDISGIVATPPNGMCPMPTNPDCDGGTECKSLFDTCLADM
jgi:hypothetical protein